MENKHIKIDLLELNEVYGKSELFDYVSGYLLEAGKIDSAEVLQEELRWRESMGNTLIEEDFAVPHIESSNVNETSMILTRLKYPVLNWIDDYSANTILFILIKKEEDPEILQDVKKIIKSLAYEETIKLLKQAEKWKIDSVLQSL
ncbi:PTS sugar transporter subunit IIA [Trichococcus shcherbakoviae]|uniref:PTS sugar transporter subunit IIA n=1 Tax=Trichococcus shcherbakoviae subsp. psychrophilus TaxID=2585775 RepID=A0A5C5E7T4_9LACT|nr:PTS sugar transporter subunit IIA [Trichococcus shcherbakoviae]TNV68312.1 PTS sugar transporter subunit IIA [Trichococcus shcherbakoviae subsp. psychrophilus]